MKTISILGCGWLGMPLGAELVRKGFDVKGSSRSEQKLVEITALGMSPFLIDLNQRKEMSEVFFESDALIFNVPPSNADTESSYFEQLDRVLQRIKPERTNVLFVSSTGVYPDANRIVTEEDAVKSASSRSGISLLEAEEKFHSDRNTIVRFGGLIDGRRHPGKWFAGKTGLSSGNMPVNLVHLDDCIGAICTIIEKDFWGEVFNICSSEHPVKSTYYPEMSLKLGLEEPSYDQSSHKDWKEVSSEKFLMKTGYQFKRSIWEMD